MSRHKFLKNLDLDDELNDYDGREDYDYGEEEEIELSDEDQEIMRVATIAVRADLPPSINDISDTQIQDSLWHTYYDVDKTIAYLSQRYASDKTCLIQATGTKGVSFNDFCGEESAARFDASKQCSKDAIHAEFFKDVPWLNAPKDRLSTFVAPTHLKGGLLGGSSSSEPPKISKLQALAATRKKIVQQQNLGKSKNVEDSLSKLQLSQNGQTGIIDTTKKPLRNFPIRKRRVSNPTDLTQDLPKKTTLKLEAVPIDKCAPLDKALPSAFANTIFSSIPSKYPRQHFVIPCLTNTSLTTDPFADPSPDDIVLAAQSKARGKGKTQVQNKKEVKPEKLLDGVDLLKIDDNPKFRSKNLDVLNEFKNSKAKNAASFVVIGHVDAGKSTLMGRLLFDMGVVSQRTIDKYKIESDAMGKSSFTLAWVLDQGSEERERGVTIDVAMSKFETPKTKLTLLDAPGHRDFIPNMIAGATQADFAILVIDASTGSFESGLKGQTKEHALLIRSIGIQKVIIAVNKLDSVDWSQERFCEIETQITSFLVTAGYQTKSICFIPCSGLIGENITKPISNRAASWYKGPTLVEALDNFEPMSYPLTKPLRMTISDVFRGGIQNLISISGRIEAGSLQVADILTAQPSGLTWHVKAIEHDNVPVDWAVAGQSIVIHLSGVEQQLLKIGDVLCSPSSPIQNIKEFTAKVLAFEFIIPMLVDVHRGGLHTTGRIKEIVGTFSKTSGVNLLKKKPKVVKPGTVARVIVKLDQSVPLEPPARIIMRSNGTTVAAGFLECL